jgi:hypothetical protein
MYLPDQPLHSTDFQRQPKPAPPPPAPPSPESATLSPNSIIGEVPDKRHAPRRWCGPFLAPLPALDRAIEPETAVLVKCNLIDPFIGEQSALLEARSRFWSKKDRPGGQFSFCV